MFARLYRRVFLAFPRHCRRIDDIPFIRKFYMIYIMTSLTGQRHCCLYRGALAYRTR